MSKLFLFITANENETEALLSDKQFFNYESQQSPDPHDTSTYNVGTFGKYDVVHFELNCQGSVKSDAAALSINSAIREYKPDAVILLGIAFGKEYEDTEEPREQHIGDVLISDTIADYESGKIKGGVIQSDGPIPQSGRFLIGAFKEGRKDWNHICQGNKANAIFGLVLSGDKVVDDRNFKKNLFESYPRAIGGEMEGRGAYYACRRNSIEEWIVVKAICDWADGNKSENKEQRQKDAAESVVSLLKHIFNKENIFDKVPKNRCSKSENNEKNISKKDSKKEKEEITLGYFINIGMTSCRLFEVLKQKKLKELRVKPYSESDPKSSDYLTGIIDHVKNDLLSMIPNSNSPKMIRVFVDYNFRSVFNTDVAAKDFTREFYEKTNLYFNILSEYQTKANLQKLFGNTTDTAIINIGSHCIDVYLLDGRSINSYNIDLSLKDVESFINKNEFPEKWSSSNIKIIKKFIEEKFNSDIKSIKASTLVILKDELSFMTKMGYQLKTIGNDKVLDISEYKRFNRKKLFSTDYISYLNTQDYSEKEIQRLYYFKYGHIVIETLAEIFEIEIVKPSDEMSIHGSRDALNAYVFNVVISGSTHHGRDKFMIEAYQKFTEMGVSVLSPIPINGKLAPITDDSEYEHLRAIDQCDVLFISNKDGESDSIGESTKCEIYYAYALRKTIVFWKKPDQERLSFIPNEHWGNIDFSYTNQ